MPELLRKDIGPIGFGLMGEQQVSNILSYKFTKI